MAAETDHAPDGIDESGSPNESKQVLGQRSLIRWTVGLIVRYASFLCDLFLKNILEGIQQLVLITSLCDIQTLYLVCFAYAILSLPVSSFRFE